VCDATSARGLSHWQVWGEPGSVACPHDILVSGDWLHLDAHAISYGNLACKSTRKSDDISVKVKARIDTLRQDQPESVE